MKGNEIIDSVVQNIGNVIIGKKYEVYNIMKGIIAGGHILIEDVPGVGKTTIVKALAKSLNLTYSRIQFTPDLLPSDITGISIFNQKSMEFEYRKGPVFSNLVLADEINRTSPKTQSALLEVMEEGQVSEGKNMYKLAAPFIVLATENPIEHKGTFTLPEAQLDRFMIKVPIGYPDPSSEVKILETYRNSQPLDSLKCIAQGEDIVKIQGEVREVMVSKAINKYIVDMVNATRDSRYVNLGASPRASLALLRIAQASAFIDGRDYVVPDDVKENAVAVLSHRLSLSPTARANNYDGSAVVNDILSTVSVPHIGD
jgi:MoxR-like ATPase